MMRTFFGLHVESDDFAGVVAAGLFEGADGCRDISPFALFSSPHHCGLDGDRWAGGDRRLTRRAETSVEYGDGRLSWFARNGGAADRGRKWTGTVEP